MAMLDCCALNSEDPEVILLVRMEEHFAPKPAKLASSPDEEKKLQARIG
jgi:hypothetical protein